MKHTPFHTQTRGLFAAVAALIVVSAVSVTALHSVHAQLRRSDTRVLQDRGPREGLKKIPTCDEAGLCIKEQRLLFPAQNVRALARLKDRGCRVLHQLQDKTVLSCPRGLPVRDARPERAFRSQDLVSDIQINTPSAWSKGITGTAVRVAVLDTGVEATHPELAGRIAYQRNFTISPSDDAHGHGTHVSGIIAGLGVHDFSGNRVTGVSTGAQLIVGKVCNDEGWCLEGDILAGIEWAVAENAKVLNLSLGGGTFWSHCDSDPLAQKVNWAVERGVVVVAAAGNTGDGVSSPGCASRAVAVGAVDSSDTRTPWSGNGDALDVMAPGAGILSSISCLSGGSCPGSWYSWYSGTSMASPHVAGVAALLLERYPHLTPAEVYTVLTTSAKDLGDVGFDTSYGFGRVDAGAALEAAKQFNHDFDGDGAGADVDCDDTNAAIHPGAIEVCNLVDDDCDGQIDEGFDLDNDGVTTCGGDCNDDDPLIFGDAPEMCNGIDDDCDGLSDDQCRAEGFCGDLVCNRDENRNTCPLDCILTDHPHSAAPENAVCGDGTCDRIENERRCPLDCSASDNGSSGRGSGNSGGATGGNSGGGNANGGARGNSGNSNRNSGGGRG